MERTLHKEWLKLFHLIIFEGRKGLLNNSCFTRNKQISLVVLIKETIKFAGVKL